MIITNDYLEQNKTPKGAWTKKQLAAIGVNWPPKKGWKKRVIGNEITEEQASKFERCKTPVSTKTMTDMEAIKRVESMGYTLIKITKKDIT